MPLIALCPYCNRGHVQAADDALGITVRCPECRSDFAFIPSSELVASSSTAESERQAVPPVKKRKKRSAVTPGESLAPKPKKKKPASRVDALLSEYTPAPAADETFPSIAVVTAVPPTVPDAARTPTLIAAILGGLGLAASQIPDYGRLICAVLCLTGLVLAGFALLGAERSRRWPGVVTGVCAVGLFLAVCLPSWLGASEWWPARTPDDATRVKAVARDGSGEQSTGEWVNAESSAWQQGDVRVTLRVEKGRVDLTGPTRLTKRTKTEHLRVTVIVLNEGVERAIDFRGWAVPHLPTLTDAAGQTLLPPVFDRGWKANTEPSQKGVLMPGKSVKQAFLYDLPKTLSTLRYELPGEVVGLTAPIRFEIPAASILLRPE